MSSSSSLHRLPDIIRIEPPRELRINVQHMHITHLRVPNSRLVVVACLILLQIDAQRLIQPQSKSAKQCQQRPTDFLKYSHRRIIRFPAPPGHQVPLHTLILQLRQPRLQSLKVSFQSLGFNLQLLCLLRDSEFPSVQFHDL